MLLVLSFMSFACNSTDGTESSSTEGPPLDVELQVASSANLEDPVEFGLVVTNIGTVSTRFNLPGTKANGFSGSVEFTVRDSDDRDVWTYSKRNQFLQGSVQEVRLAPGEELVITYEWDGLDSEANPIPAGTYSVTAVLKGTGAENGQDFTVSSETRQIEIALTG